MKYGEVSNRKTYTKARLCEKYEYSMRTLNRRLKQLGIVPAFEGGEDPIVHGKIWNSAVYREQLRLQAERRKDENEAA